MRTAAGLKDQRVILQRRLPGLDARGQANGQWVNVVTQGDGAVWARVKPLRGREWFAASQMQSGVDMEVTIDYRPDVTGAMRLLWRGQPYEIEGEPIDPFGAREELVLMCRSGVRAGR